MNRTRRNPFGVLFGEMDAVQNEFARLVGRLNPFTGSVTGSGPALNVWEDAHAVFVEADLPGFDPAQLEVTVTEGTQLTVQGERKAPEVKGASWVRQERPAGQFTRVVTLPALVDADKVEARYEHGVLRLTLPKHEAAKPRKIEVKTGA